MTVSLKRDPVVPTGPGGPEMLRRAYRAVSNRSQRVRTWRTRMADAKTDVQRERCAARLERAEYDLAFSMRRAELFFSRFRRLSIDGPRAKARASREVRLLASIYDDVIDVALVRAGGEDQHSAMCRLIERLRGIMRKPVHVAIIQGMAPDEAWTRAQEGVLKAIIGQRSSWNPLKGTLFSTYAFGRIRRELQVRANKDRPIGQRVLADGSVTPRAVSLQALADPDGGTGSCVPHAVRVGDPILSARAAASDQARRTDLTLVVREALATLDEPDRQLARRSLVQEESSSSIATAMGITQVAVKQRLARIHGVLRDRLAEFQEDL